MILDYLGVHNIITRVIKRGRQECQSLTRQCDNKSRSLRGRERFENATLLGLKIEERSTSQGMLWIS